MRRIGLLVVLVALGIVASVLMFDGDRADYSEFGDAATDADAQTLARGKYVFEVAGCASCHTAEPEGSPPLAGGHRLETPFGVFYSPNITPERQTGIGGWTAADLATALRLGIAPDGRDYYPVFPYTSYAGISDEDIRALHVYLMAQPPVQRRNLEHELAWYLRLPGAMTVWKALFFEPRPAPRQAPRDTPGRGAYIAEALAHCGECHTPRNRFGAADNSRRHAGTDEGPDGKTVPNITPARSGIGRWSARSLGFFLQTGMLPDGDFVGGRMATVVDESTSRLEPADAAALIEYLRAVPPIETKSQPAIR